VAWSGLALGGAIAFLQKAIAFAGLLAIGTALVLGRDFPRWRRALAGAAVLVVCAAVPVALLALRVQRDGAAHDFWFWNYTFDAYYYLETSFPRPSTWVALGDALLEDPLLWIGGAVGLAVAVQKRFRTEPEIVLSAVVVCGLIAVLFRSRWPYTHNLLLVEPCLALLAVRPIESALASRRLGRFVTAFFVVLFAKVSVMTFAYDENAGAAQVQRRILESTSSGDPVAVPPPWHPIFRRDSFFFWYVPEYNALAYGDLCRERPCPEGKAARDDRAWTADPPSVVYVPAEHPNWGPRDFAEHASAYVPAGPGLWERTRIPGNSRRAEP
jgi:hypothetical protein